MPFEAFEHTADVGLSVTAARLDELFADAARGLMSLIVENPDAIVPRQTVWIDLEAESVDELFVGWLQELVYRFETEHMLFSAFSIQLTDGNRRLRAECRGEAADWTRHHADTEVKGITYHQLRVAQTAAGWEARVILDI